MLLLQPSGRSLLEEYGVPPSSWSVTQLISFDQEGIHHGNDTACSDWNGGPSRQVPMSLLGLESVAVCECLFFDNPLGDQLWFLLYAITEAHRAVNMPLEGLDFTALVERCRILERHAGCLFALGEHYRNLDSVLAGIADQVWDVIQDTLDAATDVLQTPQVRSTFPPSAPDIPGEVFLGVQGMPFSFGTKEPLVEALLRSFEVQKFEAFTSDLDVTLVRIPRSHVSTLQNWTESMLDRGNSSGYPGAVHLHEVTGEDTPESIEIALSLWDPAGDSEFQDLSWTFQAARQI